MALQSPRKPSVLIVTLVFTGFMLPFNLVIDLIASSFKLDYFLDWDYLIFNIGLEGFGLFLTAIGTAFITSKFSDFHWKSVLLRMLIFATLYTALSVMISILMYLTSIGTNFEFYHSNFNVFITGMRISFIFLVFWFMIKYKNR